MNKERNSLLFYIKLYVLISVQYIKTRLAYRADFFISTIAITATNLVGVLSFFLVTSKFDTILNWGYYDLLFLYGFATITCGISDLLFDNNWNLRNSVYTGEFIKYKLRPINPFFYFISEIVNLKALAQVVFGIVLLCISWRKLNLGFSAIIIVNLIIKIITSSLIVASTINIASATSFWIVNSVYLVMFVYKLRDYARYPMKIYNGVIRVFFSIMIPLGFISYYPSLDFLNIEEVGIETLISPIIGIVFFIISYLFWMKGCNQYDGTGS